MACAAKALVLWAIVLAPVNARRAIVSSRHGTAALGSLVRPIEFKHELRVCNAFPSSTPMDVLKGKEKLTQAGPMPYKECRDFDAQLIEDDRLEFQVGDSIAGTFAVGELPASDAVLLLAVHRHDELSTAVSFESHTFAAGVESPQIAVIDTYRGSAKAAARIADAAPLGDHHDKMRDEELRFGSAVAVSPGDYEVFLSGAGGEREANSTFVALKRESYVILRTGVEAKGPGQQSFPQEVVVYPQSSVEALKGGAHAAGPLRVLLLLAFAALLGCRHSET